MSDMVDVNFTPSEATSETIEKKRAQKMKYFAGITVYTPDETIIYRNNDPTNPVKVIDYIPNAHGILTIFFSDNTMVEFNNVSYAIGTDFSCEETENAQ